MWVASCLRLDGSIMEGRALLATLQRLPSGHDPTTDQILLLGRLGSRGCRRAGAWRIPATGMSRNGFPPLRAPAWTDAVATSLFQQRSDCEVLPACHAIVPLLVPTPPCFPPTYADAGLLSINGSSFGRSRTRQNLVGSWHIWIAHRTRASSCRIASSQTADNGV